MKSILKYLWAKCQTWTQFRVFLSFPFRQEVETEQYYNYFLPELKEQGYDGFFSPKSRARTMSESDRKHVDGCAIFYKTEKYDLHSDPPLCLNDLTWTVVLLLLTAWEGLESACRFSVCFPDKWLKFQSNIIRI